MLNPLVLVKFGHPYKAVTWKEMPEELGAAVFSLIVRENPDKTEYSLTFSELPKGRWLRLVVVRDGRYSSDVEVRLSP